MPSITDIEQSVDTLSWRWIADWADIPADEGHAHHGIAVNKAGEIITGHASRSEVQVFNADGQLQRSFPVPLGGTHCITLIEEDGVEYLWIADVDGRPSDNATSVIKVDMQGTKLAELTRVDFNYAEGEGFCPTAVAYDASTGQLWVTDGYGSSRVHCFSPELKLLRSIDGTEGAAGAFACPHWVHIDTRKDEPELYIADRSNDRIQVYGTDGSFRRVIDQGITTPSGFASFGDYLVVAELRGRVFVMDQTDTILGYLGSGQHHCDKPGWPNRTGANDVAIKPLDDIPVGEFNSPHGITTDPQGNIYVSEWLLGDRFTKLQRVG
ncbi:MAG: hypothetical protein PF961_02980 [Planctomycetota bacterium]|jgi:sugar lactone lactonase YvrE|nr:hypothetical protein [Planctomycetota bacterium]